VFSYLRETEEQSILVVANLSRFSQYVELDLSRYRGRTPVELFGRTSFPVIDDRPYRISLGPHGFMWFCIACRDEDRAETTTADLPTVRVTGGWEGLLKGQGRKALREALEPYLRRHRWFAGKARALQSTDVIDVFEMGASSNEDQLRLLLVSAAYAEGEPDAYVLPLMLIDEAWAADVLIEHPHAGIIRLESVQEDRALIVCEASWNEHFWQELLEIVARVAKRSGNKGALAGIRTSAFAHLWDDEALVNSPTVHGGEQSNTSARFDERFILKLFRRVTPGVNPDLEIGRMLTEQANLPHVPKVAGALEYRDAANRPMTVAILHEFIPNVGDAWTYTLDELGRYFERVQSQSPEPALVETTAAASSTIASDSRMRGVTRPTSESELLMPRTLQESMQLEPTELARDTVGAYLVSAEQLGRRTAELHVALAQIQGDAAFSPEPFTRLYQRGLYQSMRSQARATLELLKSQFHDMEGDAQLQAGLVLDQQHAIFAQLGELLNDRIDARRIRCHGDFHLGQVLFTGKDFVIIDFEGEPERPVSERRIKASPLRDVAGMLRSFHYVAYAALRGKTPTLFVESAPIPGEKWAAFWSAWSSAAFLQAYLMDARPGGFLPTDESQVRILLRSYVLEKALYELRYELNNRPDWVTIPFEGILQLVQ
jgi:maltose alpha-D-glucosyltransferase/alpha-amylase